MAYRSGTTTADGNGTSSVITVPTGAASGDIAVVTIYMESNAAITPPDGTWTQKADIDSANAATHGRMVIFWKRLTAADSGTYTFSWTGSTWQQGACVLFSGRSTSGDPFEATNTLVAATDTTPDVPGVTATATADLFCAISQFATASTWTAPTGMTTRTTTAGQGVIATATQDSVSAGATGTETWTLNAGGFAHGFLGSLNVPGGGGSNLTASPADNLGLTDSATSVNDAVRAPADNLGLTDSLAVTNAAVRSPADTLGMTDALTVTWDRVATISDSLGITDPGQTSDMGTTLDDPLGLTDSVSSVLSTGSAKNVSDSLGLTDSLSVTWDRVVTISDPVGMSDANVKSGDLSVTLADALGMTDTLTAVLDVPAPTVTRWIFNPPTRPELVGGDSLWGRITRQVGQAVLRMQDGSFRTVNIYDPKIAGVDAVYLGGYVHTISDAEAALLTAAGYGAFLTEVTE